MGTLTPNPQPKPGPKTATLDPNEKPPLWTHSQGAGFRAWEPILGTKYEGLLAWSS